MDYKAAEAMLEEEIRQELYSLPSGYISHKIIRGHNYSYYQWKEDGKLKSRYLKKDEVEAITLQVDRRHQLTQRLRELQQAKRTLTYGLKYYLRQPVFLGEQYFEPLITQGSFYVDKTDFIREWWESGDKITLINRPRRFGKTLNLDMLNCFFSNRYAGREDLFLKLSIWQNKDYHLLQGQYPVIYLSFAAVKSSDYRGMISAMGEYIAMAYHSYSHICEDSILTTEDKARFQGIRNHLIPVFEELSEDVLKRSLLELSYFLYRYYGKKVLILMDEYDTPLQEAFFSGYWNSASILIRSLFNMTFKTNPYLERAVMTGITKISKESMFSDLNNLTVVTTTTPRYETAFGFTEEEVFAAMEAQGMGTEEQKKAVKFWYDGFCFGHHTDMYNPWSITNYLKTGELRPYWVNTSANALIGDLFAQGDPSFKSILEELIQGGSFRTALDEDIDFHLLYQDSHAVWSLLLASGYLKILPEDSISYEPTHTSPSYLLSLTNHEVALMMKNLIRRWFSRSSHEYNSFLRYLLANDVDAMNEYINRIAEFSFSAFDSGNGPSAVMQPERFYHGFVLGMIVELEDCYRIRSNRESGFGRYDIMLIPREKGNPAYVMEFKVYNQRREKDLEATLESAFRQIREKHYIDDLLDEGIPAENIHCYGFAFRGKEILLDEMSPGVQKPC